MAGLPKVELDPPPGINPVIQGAFSMRSALFCLPILVLVATGARASDPPHVMTWDPGCEHMMSTGYFELPPGQSVEIPLDFSQCAPEQLGDLIVYGYRLGKNSAPQLTARDNVRFTVTEQATGATTSSDTGYLVTPLATTGYCVLRTQNISQRKSLTVSLRSRSGL
jgi:hypothetical protein